MLGGLGLLLVLSLGVVQVYRSAPQSLAEASTRSLVAARPDAFTPNLRRAEERLQAAAAAREMGSDSAANAAYAMAAEHAWRARDAAPDEAAIAAATELWAEAMLQRAQLLQEAGTGRGLRRDDNAILRDALTLAEQVLTVPTGPETRERAEEVQAAITRQLRFGPLQWLPQRP